MAARRVMYLASLAGAVAFYIFYQQWLAYFVLIAILCLPWFSLIMSLPAIRALKTRLDYPGAVTIGESAHVRLTGECALPAPAFRGRLRVTRSMTGECETFQNSAGLLPTEHCGRLAIVPVKCRCYDYLGLFRFRLRGLEPGSVLVRPRPVPLESPPDLSRYLAHCWRPKRGGGFGENHELRLYRPGDSLQQIHWKLTAKTGKLILRETVEPEERPVFLKLDLNGTGDELDHKLGTLLWLSGYLLDMEIRHEILALTADGPRSWLIREKEDTGRAVDALLGCRCAREGSIRDDFRAAAWEYYIGGGPDEA